MAEGQILVALLAAGRAERFGGGKLDADCAGRRLGSWVLQAVANAGLSPGLAVVPRAKPAFVAEAGNWPMLVNPAPQRGLGSSLAIAARHALDLQGPAMLVLLADMPLVAPDFLLRLAAARAPAAARYPSGVPGAPALFPRDMLAALAQLDTDRGATRLLAARGDLTLIDPCPDMLTDIDRPENLSRAENLLRAREARR